MDLNWEHIILYSHYTEKEQLHNWYKRALIY